MKEVQINSIHDMVEQIEASRFDDFLIHLAERLYMGIILDYKFQNDPNLEKFKEENNLNEPYFENVSRHQIFKDGFTYPNEDVIIVAFKKIKTF